MPSIRTLAVVGAVVASVTAAVCPSDASMVAHEGTSVGSTTAVDGLTLYVSKPPGNSSDIGVLYLTDVFGIQLAQNTLLADSFARAGFLTVAPDLFDAKPAPSDLNQPGWDIQRFLQDNSVDKVDAKIAKSINYMRTTLGVKKIGVTGYCFGGRFSFRFGAAGKGADVVFAAHPSNLGDDEITAVKGPASIAASETDSMLTAERRAKIETLLQTAGVPYQLTLYGGTQHGFGVRANVSDPEQKFAKESAFLQAVRWFSAWA